MLKIGKFSTLIRVISQKSKICPILANRLVFNFSLVNKKKQLILHSEV